MSDLAITIDIPAHLLHDNPDALDLPIRRFQDRSGIEVANAGKAEAPVDRGQLRGTITHEIRGDTVVIGPNVGIYGEVMEVGSKPHWPPRAAIELWAKRHGLPWFPVARAIAKRGIKGREYMAKGLDKSEGDIERHARTLEREIVAALEDGRVE